MRRTLVDLDFEDALAPNLIMHFDVPGHFMNVETLISVSQATLHLAQSINQTVFDGQLQYQLVILPPESGSVVWKYGLWVAGALWAFASTDIGAGFVKGITNHEPAYWAEEAGKLIQHGYTSFTHDEITLKGDKDSIEYKAYDEFVSSYLMCQIMVSFLSRSESDLTIDAPKSIFSASYEARNEFYEACLADPNVNGLGFTRKNDFPISRRDFVEFLVPISPKDEALDSGIWDSEIVEISVTSPNWERADRTRSWKGRDSHGRERTFRIEDDTFWAMVKRREINADIIDKITVQWIFQLKRGNFRNHKVLRVLEYNGRKVSEPLSDKEISDIIDSWMERGDPNGQLRFDLP